MSAPGKVPALSSYPGNRVPCPPDAAARAPASLSDIREIINDIQNGRMAVIVDDENRENEGDLVMSAQLVTPEAINFMARFGRGLICLALTCEQTELLNLPPITKSDDTMHGTNFVASIEAREGVTTGISAADRARTIHAAINRNFSKGDLVSPGHVFPLEAREGGVIVRAGHTEAGVDLARLAGLHPSAVICEIIKDDGTMARLPDLRMFARRHDLKVGSIADLIRYRLNNDRTVERIMERNFDSSFGGGFKMKIYRNRIDGVEHVALVKGQITACSPTLVRMHRATIGSDILGSRLARDAGILQRSMETISEFGSGVVVIIRDPSPTAITEHIAELEAAPDDAVNELRDYGVGAQILIDLGVRMISLLSNSEYSVKSLSGFGLEIVDQHSVL